MGTFLPIYVPYIKSDKERVRDRNRINEEFILFESENGF